MSSPESKVSENEEERSNVCVDFRLYNPSSGRANFLLFGPSESGKSNLVNTLFSLESVVKKALVRHGNTGIMTNELEKYKLNDKVSIYDTWGLNFNKEPGCNYTPELFKYILQGRVKIGTNYQNSQKIFLHPKDSQKIDCVLFVIDICWIEKNSHKITSLKKYYDIVKEMNLLPIIVFTKVDSFYNYHTEENILTEKKGPVFALKAILNHNEYQNHCYFFKELISDPNAIILPIINYDKKAFIRNHIIKSITHQFIKKIISLLNKEVKNKKEEEEENEGEGEDNENMNNNNNNSKKHPILGNILDIYPNVCDDLKNYKPSSGKSNILLFGTSGVGKSPMINTLKNTVRKENIVAKFREKKKMGMVTREYNKYSFTKNKNVSIFDPWSFYFSTYKKKKEGTNFPTEFFKKMLDGKLKLGTKYENCMQSFGDDDEHLNTRKNNQNKIDAVCFVIDFGVSDLERLLTELKKYYALTKKLGRAVFFLVTKVDVFCSHIFYEDVLKEKNPDFVMTQIFKHERWNDFVELIKSNIGDPNAIVCPFINYDYTDIFKEDGVSECPTNTVIKYFSEGFVKIYTNLMEDHFFKNNKDLSPLPVVLDDKSISPQILKKMKYVSTGNLISLMGPSKDAEKTYLLELKRKYENKFSKIFEELKDVGDLKKRVLVLEKENLEIKKQLKKKTEDFENLKRIVEGRKK